MPQGNGSPPVWRWPPAFPVRGESQLHATGSGACGVGQGDGGVEDREGGREGLTRLGGAAGRGRIKTSVWDEEET